MHQRPFQAERDIYSCRVNNKTPSVTVYRRHCQSAATCDDQWTAATSPRSPPYRAGSGIKSRPL